MPREIRELKVGKITYRVWQRADGYYTFDYHDPDTGKRRHKVGTWESIVTQAETLYHRLSRGEVDALRMTNADARAYIGATELLKPLGLTVDAGARLIAEAARLLGGSPDRLIESCRWFSQANLGAGGRTIAIPALVEEFLRSRHSSDLSAVYLTKLKDDLDRFSKAHPETPIASLRTTDLETWLNSRGPVAGVGARRRRNLRDKLITLFNFARDRGYLPEGIKHAAEKIQRPKLRRGEVPIWTPAELRTLLEHARDPELPVLTIAAFAGLRSAEIARLDWSDVRFAQNVIRIPGSKTKTGEPRVVPIQPNLSKWLAAYASHHGPICGPHRFDNLMRGLLNRSGLAVPGRKRRNALRHSFGTYYCAQTKNIPEVAFIMGNSPAVVKKSYFEAVTEADAKAWFTLEPADLSKVLSLKWA